MKEAQKQEKKAKTLFFRGGREPTKPKTAAAVE
jgi:hypothetical protein